MKERNTRQTSVCPRCGGAVAPGLLRCPSCGEQVVLPEPRRRGGGKAARVFGTIFTVLFALLLTASTVVLMLLLFLYGLHGYVTIPAMGPVSADWLAMFFDAWYSVALGVVLVLLPLALLLLINAHRIRRAFFALGLSAIGTALLSLAAALLGSYAVPWLPGAWRELAAGVAAAFRDYCTVWGIALILAGGTCLSVYACIAVVKGAKHEKNT